MWEARAPVQAEAPEREAPAPEPVAPPEPKLVELVVPADAVVGLQLETTVSSERAKVEDAVEARVTRDVRVDGRVAIPAGSLVQGTVTEVVRGGKVRERARLSIRFHTVVVGNGDLRLDLRTDAITREGSSQGRESATGRSAPARWAARSLAPSSAAARARRLAPESAPVAAPRRSSPGIAARSRFPRARRSACGLAARLGHRREGVTGATAARVRPGAIPGRRTYGAGCAGRKPCPRPPQ